MVEARTSYSEPQKHGGVIVDSQWRRIHFPKTPIGVPNLTEVLHPDAARNGLLNYEAAMALAYWWMALPDDDKQIPFPALCIETRIVKVKYSYKWDTEELGVGPTLSVIDGRRATEFKERG